MTSNIPVLYVFNFPPDKIEKACKRFHCSLKSIVNQVEKIYILNASNQAINIADIDPTKIIMIHKPAKGYFNKGVLINYMVKNFLSGYEYFVHSDIDIVYPADYMKSFENIIYSFACYDPVTKYSFGAFRIIPKNIAMRYEYYTDNFTELQRLTKDTPPRFMGESRGNGLFHTESFIKIRGINEYYFGYAPEDLSVNVRLSKINKKIYADKIHTIHLWHEQGNRDYVKQNDLFWGKEQIDISRGQLIFNGDIWGEY